MRIFLFLSIILLQLGCTTVEIAKEVSKASQSIQTSVEKILKNDENNSDDDISVDKISNYLEKEKEILEAEKKETKNLADEQKKITEIKFLEKTFEEIQIDFGEPTLLRHDGNTQTIRYNTSACRLFLFFNLSIQKPKVKYFEIRDTNGNLIIEKNDVENCHKNLKLR
tara:strand:- start:248 stop:751 length:504 start_codon:yes stop_codon:yes gene_type:complete